MADYVVSQRDHNNLRRLVQEQARELKNLKNRLSEFGVRGHHGTQHLRLYQVQNNTGSERRRGDCVEVEGYLMELPDDHLDYLRLWQNGETASEANHVAILDAVLPDGQKGPAFVSGECFAYVNVTDASHEYATTSNGQHVLQSAENGPLRILHKNTSGTGEKECIVVFSSRMPSGIYLAKVPVGGIPARSGTTPGSAVVAIWKLDGGGLVDTGLTETAYNIYSLAYSFDAAEPYIQIAQDRYGLWFTEDPPTEESETTYARFIGFTITNTTGGLMKANNDQMAASVDYIIQGTTPPLDGNGELIVHDDQEVCPNALAGGSGWAIRNDNLGSDEDPYYQIIVCNQMCRQARAVLDQTMDGHETEVAIRDFFPDDESPEGLDAIEPFRSKAYNPSNHSGRNGFRVRLRWGNYTDPNGIPHQGYIIEEVQHQFFFIPAGFRVSPSKEIEARWLPVTVETHIADTADLPWEKIFNSKNCT